MHWGCTFFICDKWDVPSAYYRDLQPESRKEAVKSRIPGYNLSSWCVTRNMRHWSRWAIFWNHVSRNLKIEITINENWNDLITRRESWKLLHLLIPVSQWLIVYFLIFHPHLCWLNMWQKWIHYINRAFVTVYCIPRSLHCIPTYNYLHFVLEYNILNLLRMHTVWIVSWCSLKELWSVVRNSKTGQGQPLHSDFWVFAKKYTRCLLTSD